MPRGEASHRAQRGPAGNGRACARHRRASHRRAGMSRRGPAGCPRRLTFRMQHFVLTMPADPIMLCSSVPPAANRGMKREAGEAFAPVRHCPAAVSGNESRHWHWDARPGKRRPVGGRQPRGTGEQQRVRAIPLVARSSPLVSAFCVHESEDLPTAARNARRAVPAAESPGGDGWWSPGGHGFGRVADGATPLS